MKCKSCRFWTVIGAIIFLSLIITYQFVEPAPPKTIRIATGRTGGGYHNFALKYQKFIAKKDFQLEIHTTAGSVEALQLLKSNQVDVSFLQSGIRDESNAKVGELESIASLFYEPLWIFYPAQQPIQYLFELHGKRIAVGEEGSGTHQLVLSLLKENGVTKDNTTFLAIPNEAAAQQLVAQTIDAAFFIMSPTAATISELLNNSDLELFSFKRDLAYTSRYPFLTTVTIGEGMINLEKNIPKTNKVLLATTASLVVHQNLSPSLIRLLLMAATATHKAGGFLEKPNQFPAEQLVDYPLNAEAQRYLEKGSNWLESIFPFWLASTLDRLKVMLIPLIAVIIPLVKGVVPIYQWGIRFKIFRWYRILREVDHDIEGMKDLNVINNQIDRMKQLQRELLDVVSVPLGYMSEFYTLRIHLNLILGRLEERRQEIR
jgi:TRAP transporter TAXI family solute receptor